MHSANHTTPWQPHDLARAHRTGWLGYRCGMCRSIKTLRRTDEPATDDEVRAAALQFVRKISGYRVPSQRNTLAFDAAVDDVAGAARRLLEGLAAR